MGVFRGFLRALGFRMRLTFADKFEEWAYVVLAYFKHIQMPPGGQFSLHDIRQMGYRTGLLSGVMAESALGWLIDNGFVDAADSSNRMTLNRRGFAKAASLSPGDLPDVFSHF